MPVIRGLPQDPTDILIAGEELRSEAMLSVVGLAFEPLISPIAGTVRGMYVMLEDDETIPGTQTLNSPHRMRGVIEGNLVNNNSVISTPCGALVPVFGIGRIMLKEFAGGSNVFYITGVTRDNTGSALGNCEVYAFDRWSWALVGQTVSDGSGNYTVAVPGNGNHIIVSYLSGSPDRAGVSLRTLTPE